MIVLALCWTQVISCTHLCEGVSVCVCVCGCITCCSSFSRLWFTCTDACLIMTTAFSTGVRHNNTNSFTRRLVQRRVRELQYHQTPSTKCSILRVVEWRDTKETFWNFYTKNSKLFVPSCEFSIKSVTLQVDSFLVACLLYCMLNTVFQLIIYTKWIEEVNIVFTVKGTQ